jgi:dTDP-4-amino-4,6-dideoxygalactose transaminase
MNDKSIKVTKTLMPSREVYNSYLDQVWESRWLTNMGPLSLELEKQLEKKLGVNRLSFVTNGTIAIQLAIKALDLSGDIITTPFSYVATTSSIVWENCRPVFVDIDDKTFNINPSNIENAITQKTTAILATHVYGVPCDVDEIGRIAKKHGLKVIYDAAHSFGVNYKGRSILNYGDCSTLSFHATKLFHTGEGGAVVCADNNIQDKINYLRNFGHNGTEAFFGLGINGKNSELHASMGLSVLPLVDNEISQRKRIFSWYDEILLPKLSGYIYRPVIPKETDYNFAYYPIFFSTETDLLKAKFLLEKNDIFPRRYFYPSLATLNYVTSTEVPKAIAASKVALCLPMFSDLSQIDAIKIASLVVQSRNEAY